jgi:hypothetical protein
MLKDIGEDTRDEALQDVELPRGVPVRDKGFRETTKNRSPSGEARPGQRPVTPEGEQQPAEAKSGEQPRKSFLRRRPIASASGAILAAALMGTFTPEVVGNQTHTVNKLKTCRDR